MHINVSILYNYFQIVGSVPSYPHGCIDDLSELSRVSNLVFQYVIYIFSA